MKDIDRLVLLGAVGIFIVFLYLETVGNVSVPSALSQAVTQANAAPPIVQNQSSLATSQSGGGLFGNPSNLGSIAQYGQTTGAAPADELPQQVEQA